MKDDETDTTRNVGRSKPIQTGNAGRSDETDRTNVGSALRAVYQDAIGENVPDEFLDLLEKLK